MYASRKCNACLLPVSPSMHCIGEFCSRGGVCLCSEGVHALWGRGVCSLDRLPLIWGGRCLLPGGGSASQTGVYPSMQYSQTSGHVLNSWLHCTLVNINGTMPQTSYALHNNYCLTLVFDYYYCSPSTSVYFLDSIFVRLYRQQWPLLRHHPTLPNLKLFWFDPKYQWHQIVHWFQRGIATLGVKDASMSEESNVL